MCSGNAMFKYHTDMTHKFIFMIRQRSVHSIANIFSKVEENGCSTSNKCGTVEMKKDNEKDSNGPLIDSLKVSSWGHVQKIPKYVQPVFSANNKI